MSAATLPAGGSPGIGTPYGSRGHPALGRSFALSAFVHLVLLAVMFLGVRFQNSPPAVVNVELWEVPPQPQPVQEVKPPPPAPEAKAEVKPPPEPEPEVKKPDIAVVEKPKPKPKPKPAAPKRDLAFEKQLREQAAAEERQLQDRLIREQAAQASAALRNRALLAWTDKIRAKIRGNIILPQDIPGNPEAIFDVTLLPTGEVLTVRKTKSSGHPGYDDAVERAISKSSPLPLPDDRSLFQRQLQLRFRPQDR
jgi:colicin import membrane protein